MIKDFSTVLRRIKWNLWRFNPRNIILNLKILISFPKQFSYSKFGSSCKIVGDCSKMKIGRGLELGDLVRLQPGSIYFGREVYLGHNNYVYGDVKIGDYFMSGPNVSLMGGNHGVVKGSIPMRYQANTTKGIIIGDDVWVGANSVILDGVKVGNGVVVAAGSVVTKDLDECGIYGGCPARLISTRKSDL